MDDAALLELAADLAQRAGEVILAVRARGFETLRKADRSPVTEADHAAEALIVEGLRAADAGHPGHRRGGDRGRAWRPQPAHEYWLVDPLDGTREFAALRDEFTVNIGLVRDGRPVLGAVGVPAHGELFGGMLGPPRGRLEADGGRASSRSRRAHPPDARDARAGQPALRGRPAARRVPGRAARSPQVTNMGSALKIVRLAEGAGDLYPRFGRTMEWDTAAPQAVLEAAGGRLCGMDGTPLRYGKPGWANPPFLCTGAFDVERVGVARALGDRRGIPLVHSQELAGASRRCSSRRVTAATAPTS